MPRTDGDPGISSGLCQGTAYVILQHLIREHSVASASDDDHWFALDLDSDAVVDIKIGREEVTQLARLLHPR